MDVPMNQVEKKQDWVLKNAKYAKGGKTNTRKGQKMFSNDLECHLT